MERVGSERGKVIYREGKWINKSDFQNLNRNQEEREYGMLAR